VDGFWKWGGAVQSIIESDETVIPHFLEQAQMVSHSTPGYGQASRSWPRVTHYTELQGHPLVAAGSIEGTLSWDT
jgi:hypothetical protein